MISRFVANSEKCRKYTFLGRSAQIITILHRGGSQNLLQYYMGRGGVFPIYYNITNLYYVIYGWPLIGLFIGTITNFSFWLFIGTFSWNFSTLPSWFFLLGFLYLNLLLGLPYLNFLWKNFYWDFL